MKITLISTSHRINSQSNRVANIINNKLKSLFKLEIFYLDLSKESLPLWTSGKKNASGVWKNWPIISKKLKLSDGFIFIIPEYGGMATPNSKNFFLLCGDGELAHKPGLIVSISSGNGGAYPVSELRASSYKNTHIMWIPENIIIRNVEQYNPGNHGEQIPDWIDNRVEYTLNLFLAYSKHLKPLAKLINRKDFGNGM